MKKIISSAALLGILTISAFAWDGNDAPAAVKSKFALLYPSITKIKWEKEDANYEAEFKSNDVRMSCLFDASGNLLETENEIEISALPKTVINYMQKNYPNKKIKEAAKITDSKNVIIFETEVKEGDLLFDAQGNFLKKSYKEQ